MDDKKINDKEKFGKHNFVPFNLHSTRNSIPDKDLGFCCRCCWAVVIIDGKCGVCGKKDKLL